ncbi:hypothetical protein SAMN05428949_4716 [Chitinophaga sp. YR627]|uniref:hypothetical protein n=1 Tax=Chitinophaga sp. YR627 TaxID=1881041 RepID=UPI0008E4D015|nr:hypothetical protein [Chitinophaga sp. YR627]SFO26633.1 hypothetical protein SAMN05428949_4716 [Chitinophaga sp. YR627]
MAKSSDNIILKGAFGTIGDMLTLTRKRSGQLILGKKRRASRSAPTDAQLEVQQRFKLGIQYAKAVLLDPVKKAFYAALAGPDQSAYNIALKDAVKPPEVISINTENYTGAIGGSILVRAVDSVKVARVRVNIRTATDENVEQGEAILQANGIDWLYISTAVNAALEETVITATAIDTPGNEAMKEVVM